MLVELCIIDMRNWIFRIGDVGDGLIHFTVILYSYHGRNMCKHCEFACWTQVIWYHCAILFISWFIMHRCRSHSFLCIMLVAWYNSQQGNGIAFGSPVKVVNNSLEKHSMSILVNLDPTYGVFACVRVISLPPHLQIFFWKKIWIRKPWRSKKGNRICYTST